MSVTWVGALHTFYFKTYTKCEFKVHSDIRTAGDMLVKFNLKSITANCVC